MIFTCNEVTWADMTVCRSNFSVDIIQWISCWWINDITLMLLDLWDGIRAIVVVYQSQMFWWRQTVMYPQPIALFLMTYLFVNKFNISVLSALSAQPHTQHVITYIYINNILSIRISDDVTWVRSMYCPIGVFCSPHNLIHWPVLWLIFALLYVSLWEIVHSLPPPFTLIHQICRHFSL